MRDIAAREKQAYKAYQESQRQVGQYRGRDFEYDVDDDDDLDPDVQKIYDESKNIKRICNNAKCLRAKMKNGKEEGSLKMLRCTGCSVATYCSVSRFGCGLYCSRFHWTYRCPQAECQKIDWPRHKKEPCRPFEELVEDDDVWNDYGTRVGTGRFGL